MLFAAGLITGEALMGIFIAVRSSLGSGRRARAARGLQFGGWLGLLIVAGSR